MYLCSFFDCERQRLFQWGSVWDRRRNFNHYVAKIQNQKLWILNPQEKIKYMTTSLFLVLKWDLDFLFCLEWVMSVAIECLTQSRYSGLMNPKFIVGCQNVFYKNCTTPTFSKVLFGWVFCLDFPSDSSSIVSNLDFSTLLIKVPELKRLSLCSVSGRSHYKQTWIKIF